MLEVNKPIETGKRAVAFLDVLGFKKMIQTMELTEIAKQYKNLVLSIQHLDAYYQSINGEKNKLCKQFIFSDSIVLFANDDSEKSFIDLVTYTWRFLQMSIAMKLPLRGAITYGEVYIDEINNVFLGEGLVNAVLLESKQEWIGVIIDHVLEEKYESVFSNENLKVLTNSLMYKYDVPFKNGTTNLYRALNWRLNMVVDKGTRSLFDYTKDPAIDQKIDNTLSFAETIIINKCPYIDGEGLPAQFRVFFVGEKEPPFQHGDEL